MDKKLLYKGKRVTLGADPNREVYVVGVGEDGVVSLSYSESSDLVGTQKAANLHEYHPSREVIKNIKALWWKQPYAQLMLHGKVETRSRNTNVRGRVLICSTKSPFTSNEVLGISGAYQFERINQRIVNYGDDTPLGMAIAVGEIYDSVPMKLEDESDCFVAFDPMRYCWKFRHVRPIKPFEVKGAQGWRNLSNVEVEYLDTVSFVVDSIKPAALNSYLLKVNCKRNDITLVPHCKWKYIRFEGYWYYIHNVEYRQPMMEHVYPKEFLLRAKRINLV